MFKTYNYFLLRILFKEYVFFFLRLLSSYFLPEFFVLLLDALFDTGGRAHFLISWAKRKLTGLLMCLGMRGAKKPLLNIS